MTYPKERIEPMEGLVASSERESVVEKSIVALSEEIGGVQATLETLKNRLGPVLIEPTPTEDVKRKSDSGVQCRIVLQIAQQQENARRLGRTIEDIIVRLQI
jgi:hypothetical protein